MSEEGDFFWLDGEEEDLITYKLEIRTTLSMDELKLFLDSVESEYEGVIGSLKVLEEEKWLT